jgi:hypothetical protein
MNSFLIGFLLLLLPIVLQATVGVLSLRKRIKVAFWTISLLNTLLLIGFVFVGVELINYDLSHRQGVIKCGTPFVAFMFLGFVMLIVQLIVITIQLAVKKLKKR